MIAYTASARLSPGSTPPDGIAIGVVAIDVACRNAQKKGDD